ncbi:unnamed protein product [Toxocara canis]|uniref:Peroxisomal membrane protein PEX16 n=1 Tax=Toxocara canis TaxID=6265 RepID=A0A183V9I0_TOXCA|nr:unnamed protein product [Toxocara canis]
MASFNEHEHLKRLSEEAVSSLCRGVLWGPVVDRLGVQPSVLVKEHRLRRSLNGMYTSIKWNVYHPVLYHPLCRTLAP